MKSYVSSMPAASLKLGEPPVRRPAHAKVRAFWNRRTDDQIMDMIVCLERVLATHGQSPTHLKAALVLWTGQQP